MTLCIGLTSDFKAEAVRRKLQLAVGSVWSWIPNLFQLLKHTWSSPQALESLSLNCIWLNFVVLALLLTTEGAHEMKQAERLTMTVILFLLNGLVLSGFLWHMVIEVQHILAAVFCGHRQRHLLSDDEPLINSPHEDSDDTDMEEEMLLVAGEDGEEDDDEVAFVEVSSKAITPEQQVRQLRRKLREVSMQRQKEAEAHRQETELLTAQLNSAYHD